ncbi:MAG: hypothetical protein LQ342_005494 [Letrouitia transgressa]|nr:MAG: hypothetical protein LQ342_005494 [Letrouitia transgressa]
MLIDPAPKPRHVHGSCELPLGFRIVPLKKDSRIFTQEGGTLDHVELSSYHNIPKAIIAIVQTVTASFALYRAKGNQIELYGYASFGLTLLPYILMSIMNLITAICVPDYPTVFIVSSRASEEAIAKGGSITGTVGRLYEPDSKSNSEPESTPGSEPRSELLAKPLESNDNASTGSIHPEGEGQEPLAKTTADENDHGTRSERQNTFRVSDPLPNDPPSVMVRNHSWSRYTKWSGILIVSIVFGAIPFTVNGSLSHFDSNRSSILQQVLTMSWLVLGIFYGPVIEITTTQRWSMELEKDPAIQESLGFILSSLVIVLFLAAPAIGGFVVVGQMLKDYGSCTRVAGLAS